VISHETALSVHGIGEFESPRVHLTVPPGFTSSDKAVRLHVADLPEADVVDRTRFRVTTAVRSLIDVAASGVDEDQLARAIAEAGERGLVSMRQLRARAEVIDARAALYIERALRRTEAS
jgi:predicted transcriptional regulator of viral defense system